MSHTWNLYIRYHLCPLCQQIVESRHDFIKEDNKYLKNLSCPRCGHAWQEEEKGKIPLGPIFGSPTHPEFTWE